MRKVRLGIQTFTDKGVICKLFAIVKGEGVASLFVRPEQINNRLTDQVRRLEVDLLGKGVPRTPVHQCDDGALVVLAHHGVALNVAYPAFLIDYLRALLNAHAAFDGAAPLSAAAVALSPLLLAAQVLGQIALGLLVSQDTLVDGLVTDLKALFEEHTIGNLLRRDFLAYQGFYNDPVLLSELLGVASLALTGLSHNICCIGLVAPQGDIAFEFSGNAGSVTTQLQGYLGAVMTLASHQTNLVSFFSAQVCVVHGASLRLAGQKAAILCALEPTRFTHVHFVLEFTMGEKGVFLAFSHPDQQISA